MADRRAAREEPVVWEIVDEVDVRRGSAGTELRPRGREDLRHDLAFARHSLRELIEVLRDGAPARGEPGHEATVAAFYKHLPLASMRCSLDAAHLSRRQCEDCGLAFCRLCDAIVHDDPARATHRRHPLGHVAWDVSGVQRLERALAAPLGTPEPIESELEHGPQVTRGIVLRDGSSAAAKLHGRSAPVVVDSAMRARIVEHFTSATGRTHVSVPTPAG